MAEAKSLREGEFSLRVARAQRGPPKSHSASTFWTRTRLQIEHIPRELIVVGAGVIGLEYASMLTALNVKVTVIDQKPTILNFVDHEIAEALSSQMRRQGVVFRLAKKSRAWKSMNTAW